ncbi:MAG TPA: ankyrin repeat domain-containing protein [Bryobacteraceae bacterium]|nr:ankyrin repeat domain-containing protein [Bryobacteraceae bacterium]
MRCARIITGCAGACALIFVSAAGLAASSADVRLIEAVKNSDGAAVRSLLQSGASANAREVDGTTALDWAVSRDDRKTVELLLGTGADVKAANRYGASALLIACNNASAATVELLLKAGADPNSASPEGETALMTAARAGKADVIQVLYRAGANVNAKESWHGQSAVMWAAAGNYPGTIETLKELGADLNSRSDGGFTALLFAVREGHLEAAQTLLKLGANVNDTIQPKQRPAQPARPQANYIDNNVNRGRMINAVSGSPIRPAGPGGTSALVLAITNAHFALAKYLIEQGADVNAAAQGWTPLIQLEYVRRPNHGKGLPPPEPIDTFDSLELAKLLLAHGADPNARQTREISDGQRNYQNRVGATAFFLAAKHADIPMMRLLAEHGADPLIKTEDGTTALAAAAGVGIWNVGESAGTNEEAFQAVKLVYELGCKDVNAADAFGYAPLHGAALRGSPAIVQFLVDKGADLTVRTKDEKWTPLRIADGVYYTGTVKRAREAGSLLRQLMQARGLPVPEFKDDVDYGIAHQQVAP